MDYSYIKALHIIFVVTWFSGMFYLGRLFIYNREAQDKEPVEKEILTNQFNVMIRRLLFGICWPSAVLTWIFGLWLLTFFPSLPTWLIIKIGLVLILTLYQISLDRLFRTQQKGQFRHSSFGLRIWNEVPTLFLVSIVMLVVVKQNMSPVYGLLGLIIFIVVLMSAIGLYKRFRESRN